MYATLDRLTVADRVRRLAPAAARAFPAARTTVLARPAPSGRWPRSSVAGLGESSGHAIGTSPPRRSLAGTLRGKVNRQPADESWSALRDAAANAADPDRPA